MSDDTTAPPWENILWRTTSRYILTPASPAADPILLSQAPEELSGMKDRIMELDDDRWEYYKKITNKYELIFTVPGRVPTPPSICAIHPLSRSYFKMIEMLHVFGIAKGAAAIKTGHVCEGPGGFIQAIYDYAGRYGTKITRTTAMTLKPVHHYVPGWKRATAFLKKNPQIKVIYGALGTGDILEAENRAAYVAEVHRSLHIFTADGGVDFTTNYRGQEQTIFPILVASAAIAIKCLVAGGTFVLKIFDSFGQNTLDLMMGLGTLFQRWTLYKPATSRPCNSEQYFVGVGFNLAAPMLPIVTAVLDACLHGKRWEHRLWDVVPADVAGSILDEQLARMRRQIDNLEATFMLAMLRNDEVNEALWERNIAAARDFCRKFSLLQVPCGL